ncbi:hypothetical protein Clacol_003962 [Clathrus columnatus]|uniref:Uncharacterized protein n=1 Tax=Clathrus columnatus TaxID=1419009 RepID=A0AAV5A8G2_9AGAM|nr:hypothetical protein Clacol_003962 [Clathrus columnatus]
MPNSFQKEAKKEKWLRLGYARAVTKAKVLNKEQYEGSFSTGGELNSRRQKVKFRRNEALKG